MMNESQVLIVGAGPTGLVLALFLAKAGITPRIIEKNTGPGQASRAMVVQARTLEFYRQLGFAEEVVSKGIPMRSAHLREGNREVTEIKIGDFGAGLSPYPFVLSFPQDDHERLLGEHLQAAGMEIEWGTELTDFRDDGDQVHATLRRNGVEETCTADYLCGCDGAHSAVRHGLGTDFPGGTYTQRFFVADAEAKGDAAVTDGFSMCLGAHALCLVFPIRSTGMHRLIGLVPDELSERENLTFEDIQPFVEKLIGLHVTKLNWFSLYRVHHRVAEHFRADRVLLLGDAGHIHSPAGGQGMNTGIGDAVNLAWKTGEGIGHQLFRETLVPHLAPFLLGFSGARTAAFRLVSQTRIHYGESALSDGAAGAVHGGDRLPWVPLESGSDNFEPLKSLDWQVHVYGETGQDLREAAQNAGLALHQFDWSEAARTAGLKRDALYLIRPDGYVALADARQDAATLQAYLARFQIKPLPGE